MIRGTTAQFKFKLPYAREELQWVTIKFWQEKNPNKYLPILKNLDHCPPSSDDSKALCVSLTADETLLFSDKYKAKIQLRGMKNDGTVFGCKQQLVTVYPLDDELAGDITAPINDGGWIVLDGDNIIN
jgi:hypothetical protein